MYIRYGSCLPAEGFASGHTFLICTLLYHTALSGSRSDCFFSATVKAKSTFCEKINKCTMFAEKNCNQACNTLQPQSLNCTLNVQTFDSSVSISRYRLSVEVLDVKITALVFYWELQVCLSLVYSNHKSLTERLGSVGRALHSCIIFKNLQWVQGEEPPPVVILGKGRGIGGEGPELDNITCSIPNMGRTCNMFQRLTYPFSLWV